MAGIARFLLRYVPVVFVIGLLWQAASSALGGMILPPPMPCVKAFLAALFTTEFWAHFNASALRAVAGMALAWGVAFPLGILMGGSRKADSLLAPFVFLTYPVPKIVLLPVFLLVLGLGDTSKVAMIALILGYQILVTTRDGVRAVDPRYVDSVLSLGGSRWDVLRHVLFPAALPHGFTSLRLGTGVSVAVLFFVESFATNYGLGYLIMDSWGAMDYVTMFTGILGMSLLGAALYECAELMERHVCRWMAARNK